MTITFANRTQDVGARSLRNPNRKLVRRLVISVVLFWAWPALHLDVTAFGVLPTFRSFPFHRSNPSTLPSRRHVTASETAPPDQQNQTQPLVSSSPPPRGFVSPEEIDLIARSADLVTIIENAGVAQFRRTAPDKAVCLCPFHDDHNPSMHIDNTRGIYKCFSCGAGGNVYNFVREVGKLNGEEVSFRKALQIVNETIFLDGPGHLAVPDSNSSTYSTATTTTSLVSSKVKEARIRLANLAAAAFYEDCLVSRPTAGAARAHLRARGVAPRTVRAFGMGYAPDSYFQTTPSNNENDDNDDKTNSWGDGSLVHHLIRKGFTTTEIVEAGLATVTKRGIGKTGQAPKVPLESSLMDRFRNRIVIPILDATGETVLGFGGRILDDDDDPKTNKFQQPKYLNSPESIIFKKKNTLFGQHMADRVLRFWEEKDDTSRPVVLVEGYMDAISLWQAGIEEAVASMGTGLTVEQVTAAAEVAGSKNGRVVFCLDNDSAGIMAMERVCNSDILLSVLQTHPVEFLVAEMPANVKDPDEFLHGQPSDTAGEAFRSGVIAQAISWDEWYKRQLVSKLNKTAATGEKGSFEDIVDQGAIFLSRFKDEEMRKAQCHDLAVALAECQAKASGLAVPDMVSIQLESNLLQRSSNLIKKNFLPRPRDTDSPTTDDAPDEKLNKVLARMAPKNEVVDPSSSQKIRQNGAEEPGSTTNQHGGPQSTQRQGGRRFRVKGQRKFQEPALTPHFSGVTFKTADDKLWVGDLDTLSNKKQYTENGSVQSTGKVYFNSNEYHGGQFLSDEAARAGYERGQKIKGHEVATKGVGSLLQTDDIAILEATETELLTTLLRFPQARIPLKEVIEACIASGLNQTLKWSTSEKQQLFECLLQDDNDKALLRQTNSSAPLQSLVLMLNGTSSVNATNQLDANAPALPPEGEKNSDNNLASANSMTVSQLSETEQKSLNAPLPLLDVSCTTAFVQTEAGPLSDEKISMSAQESYYTLMWLSTLQTADTPLSHELLGDSLSGTNTSALAQENSHQGMENFQAVVESLRLANQNTALLESIMEKLNGNLITKAAQSTAWKDGTRREYDELSIKLQTHMEEIAQLVDSDDVNPDDEEHYEDTLEATLQDWGEIFYDDNFWSPRDPGSPGRALETAKWKDDAEAPPQGVEESMDDFLERMESDWSWLEDRPSEGSDFLT